MRYSLKFIENGFAFGLGFFTNAHDYKKGFAVSFLFWELTIGVGRMELPDINTLWN
jgi:hypothetical protein